MMKVLPIKQILRQFKIIKKRVNNPYSLYIYCFLFYIILFLILSLPYLGIDFLNKDFNCFLVFHGKRRIICIYHKL